MRLILAAMMPAFLSTLSLRRATWHATFPGGLNAFLSTLSLRRATFVDNKHIAWYAFLSTLSLRRATSRKDADQNHQIFLSTLSLRRATPARRTQGRYRQHFYPRSPCGERPAGGRSSPITETFLSTLSLRRATVHVTEHASPCRISIHALLAESDQRGGVLVRQPEIFLSTLSLRRATRGPEARIRPVIYFYPRSPCGERRA